MDNLSHRFFLFEEKSKVPIGQLLFYLGLFLLPSAFSISTILLIISSILGFFIPRENYFKDKWNIPFFIATLLLILSSIYNSLSSNDFFNYDGLKNINSHIGLFNWIPFTLSFYGFQAYLQSKKARKNSALLLLSGTVPVFISIIGQLFLDWHGPIEALNGLIVWYQRPLNGITEVTGLFNNPNYLGSWLIIIWPFSLAAFINKDKEFFNILATTSFIILIAASVILCASRGAWLSFVLSIPLFFGSKSYKWFIPILIFLGTIFLSIFIPIFGDNFQSLMREFIPSGIWSNFSLSTYSADISRVEIWQNALKLIIKNPLLGSGSSSFPTFLESQTGIWKGHSHNLILELMLSYGIPVALLILVPFTLLIKSALSKVYSQKKIHFHENIFDRAWIISLILLALMHLFDIQYFDGRISIAGWVLLSGIRNIVKTS